MSRKRYTKKRYEPSRQVFSDTGPVEIVGVEDEVPLLEQEVKVFNVEEYERMNIDKKAIQTPSTPSEVVEAQEKLEDEPTKTVQVEPQIEGEAEPAEDPGESSESSESTVPDSEMPTDAYPAVDATSITGETDYDKDTKAQQAGEFMQDVLHAPPQDTNNGFTITTEDNSD